MALTQSNTLDQGLLSNLGPLFGGQPKSQGLQLNPGGYNTLFGNTPSGNVTTPNAPGIVPQVYSGSTGAGSNQNTSTSNYGGFTPQQFQPYTPNWSSNQQNNGGGTASAFDAWRSAMGGGTQASGGVQTANAQTTGAQSQVGQSQSGYTPSAPTGGGIQQAFAGLTPQQKATYIQANPQVASQYGLTAQTTPTTVGSFNLNGVQDSLTSGGQQSQVNNNVGTSAYTAPTNTGPNPNPGNTGDPFSGMNGLYAKMLSDYYNRTKQFDDSDLNVNKTSQDLEDFQKNYANTIAGVEGNNNWSLDTQQGKAQVLGNQAANTLPYLQTKLNQATALRGQNLNAMSDLAGKMKPIPYDVYMDPVTGQPINQGGAGGALFQKGINQGTQQAGYDAAGSNVAVNQSDALAQQFMTQLSAAPDFQSNPVNVVNALFNAYKGNVSDPKYAGLSTSFSTIVNNLKGVLGQDTIDQAMNFVHSNPQALQSTINSLISQAKTKVQYSNPQGASAPSSNTSSSSSFGQQW